MVSRNLTKEGTLFVCQSLGHWIQIHSGFLFLFRPAGWWLNQPSWKSFVKMDHFPILRVELENHSK